MDIRHALSSTEKSTNGRVEERRGTGTPPQLVTLRRSLAIASAISPRLAGWWAARLFVTPRRHPRPPREQAVLERGERLWRRADGLAAWRWGHGPTVLLVHGWEGRGAQLGAFVEPLALAGHRVVAFDAPAHGVSRGHQATLIDFAQGIGQVASRVGPIHALVAHSFGAAAATIALQRGLVDAHAAVFVAPPVRLDDAVRHFAGLLELPADTVAEMRRTIEHRVGLSWEEVDLERAARRMTAPLLVAHDRGDEEIPWAAGAALSRVWPAATLHTTDGLGHRRILRDPTVIGAAVEFIADYSQPRPATDLDRFLGAHA